MTSLPIYMDVHVPAAITAGLRRHGIDVLTSQEDGSNRWPDDRVLNRATELGRILFSQDDDLLRLAAEYQQQSHKFAGVIYAHQLSTGIGTLVLDLTIVLACLSAEEFSNQVVYLPLK